MQIRTRLGMVAILMLVLSSAPTSAQLPNQRPIMQGGDDKQQDQLVSELISDLKENSMDPVEFVVSKFGQHDIVMLGEEHHVKETCDFVASLIEPLNAIGVKRLCSEFTPSRLNGELKTIVTDKEFDETAVSNLFRRGPWPNWGHREYMDIIKTVWSVNQNLAKDELPFLIVGIDSNWSQVEQFKMDRKQRFEMTINREQNMNRVIVETAIEQKQKTLVHIGFAHTVPHGVRVGNELKKNYGESLYQVMMHHALKTRKGVSEITTIIERSFAEGKLPAAGFDVAQTPIAILNDPAIPYVTRFNDLAMGYIFLKPVGELSGTTWVDGFINDENFDDAMYLAEKFGWTKEGSQMTPAELDKLCAEKFGSR